jgi:inorganic pyrophosphatase
VHSPHVDRHGSRPVADGARAYTHPMQSPGTFPDVVEIVVEIPRGSRNKYEYDEEARVYRLDRVLSSAVLYNFDYGFIEGTRAGDGDHTDALLVIDEPTFTGCHVWARPIGGLEMRDEKGFDFKVLCVALGDAHQQHIERLEQVRPHRLVEIEHFFQTYKALEDKTVEMVGWRERERAHEVLRTDRALWLTEHETMDDPGPSGRS